MARADLDPHRQDSLLFCVILFRLRCARSAWQRYFRSSRFHYLMSKLIILMAVALPLADCWHAPVSAADWQWPSWLSTEADPPGTPDWWKKNKKRALFEPGKGYSVEGVEGYFDQEGRPMNTKVAKVVHLKKNKSSSLLEDVNLMQSVTDLKKQVGLGPDQQAAEQTYAAGEDSFRREAYGEAAKLFKQTISRWPDSKLEQDAMFFLGESQFFDNKYPEAIETYSKLLKKYPNSLHLDKVIRRQFDIARYWEKYHQYKPRWATTPNLFDNTRPLFDTLGRSLKAYENIRLNDPTGPLADDSVMATANSHFLRERYDDADYYYELVRREYPRSEHQFEAHILGLQCKLRKYQGPDYDGTPLLEAKKLVKQLKTQFAGEMNTEERNRLAEIRATLIKQLAARDFKRAKGYDTTEHFESARFYYSELVRDYPDTPLAELAKQRYQELAGEPAHPKTNMGWLIAMFPENSERKAIAQVPMVESDNQIQIANQPKNTSPEAQTVVR